ncbi:MAG TPA: 16S rRNA (guanine(527)-N(7))-methyltransferase RsmG [Thermoanaerobaculia bacterium]|jgi:16S rRNA (guanine527-N7)-methyltransferase|nr:16S rRNA (guanine(527)-N(7))-methyltransferase RsmG [Thermoanaerobaculia bacterium]
MSRDPASAEFPQPPERFARLLASARAKAIRGASAHQLARYLSELDAWRQRINLTGRLTPEELVAHALESLPAIELIADGESVIDIGSGAGFPALPLAILRPEAAFTLVEPTSKKAAFLRHAARALPLPNVTVRAARLQDVHDVSFDVATTRAVGSLGALLGPAAFLRPGGRLLAWTTEPDALAGELSVLRLTKTLPIAGSRAKVVAVFEKPGP